MRRIWLLATAVPVFALAVASLVSLPKKLIYNASASAPMGLYWLDNRPVERGDYVLVRVPDRVWNLVIERGYLPPDVPLLSALWAWVVIESVANRTRLPSTDRWSHMRKGAMDRVAKCPIGMAVTS